MDEDFFYYPEGYQPTEEELLYENLEMQQLLEEANEKIEQLEMQIDNYEHEIDILKADLYRLGKEVFS